MLRVDSETFFTKKSSTHIVASSCMLLVLHASLKVTRNPMIEFGSLQLKKSAFICSFIFSPY